MNVGKCTLLEGDATAWNNVSTAWKKISKAWKMFSEGGNIFTRTETDIGRRTRRSRGRRSPDDVVSHE